MIEICGENGCVVGGGTRGIKACEDEQDWGWLTFLQMIMSVPSSYLLYDSSSTWRHLSLQRESPLHQLQVLRAQRTRPAQCSKRTSPVVARRIACSAAWIRSKLVARMLITLLLSSVVFVLFALLLAWNGQTSASVDLKATLHDITYSCTMRSGDRTAWRL